MDANGALQQSVDQGKGVGNLLNQEKLELGPLEEKVAKDSATPTPQPQLEKAPQLGSGAMTEGATQWVATVNILAGLAGAVSRQHATTALDAFASGMNGFKQGKADQIKAAQEQFKDSNAQVIETNKTQIEAYKAILQDKKISIDQQMAEIKNISSQYHNEIVSQLAEQRNFTAVARVMDMMQSNNDKLSVQVEKLQAQIDQFNDKVQGPLQATQAYKNIYAPGGVMVKGAPDFGTWYKTTWPTLQKQQGGGQGGQVPGMNASDLGQPGKGGVPTPQGAGRGRVNVISPDGTLGDIPADQLDSALAAGYKKQ